MSNNVSESANNKRLAKNTIFLYIRMVLLMLIGLYTSRVILSALGAEDYGIYNVVGGVVTMFTMISGALRASISRYITFELGTGNIEKLKKVFSTSVSIQIILSIILIIFAETVGLWFLNNKLIIPENRMYAANWVYQFSVLTFVINIISVPYNSAVVAHEKMSAFAYISIAEGLAKLLIAWGIVISPIDSLIFYGLALCLVALSIRFLYGWYCNKHFEECKYSFYYDHGFMKRMFGFASWNMIGASSAILRDQGGNIILNLFFGPTINAARGIAIQVNSIVNNFVSNFQTALNPQITKSYAQSDFNYVNKLVNQGSKYSYYILLLIALPFVFSGEYILSLWLGDYPEHTPIFMSLILVFSLIESLSGPLLTAMYATEKIKNYQIVVGGLQMLNLPIAYGFLCWGFEPEIIFIVAIIMSIICLLARLVMLKPLINLSISKYVTDVFLKVILVSVLSAIAPFAIKFYALDGFFGFFLTGTVCVVSTAIVIYFIGLDIKERHVVNTYIHKMIKKIHS